MTNFEGGPVLSSEESQVTDNPFSRAKPSPVSGPTSKITLSPEDLADQTQKQQELKMVFALCDTIKEMTDEEIFDFSQR
jgi:hypothetical protein